MSISCCRRTMSATFLWRLFFWLLSFINRFSMRFQTFLDLSSIFRHIYLFLLNRRRLRFVSFTYCSFLRSFQSINSKKFSDSTLINKRIVFSSISLIHSLWSIKHCSVSFDIKLRFPCNFFGQINCFAQSNFWSQLCGINLKVVIFRDRIFVVHNGVRLQNCEDEIKLRGWIYLLHKSQNHACRALFEL